MTHTEIVNKLIGSINPVGSEAVDKGRYENLKKMCELIGNLVNQVEEVISVYNPPQEHSKIKAAKYSKEFLEQLIGNITTEKE